MLKEEAIYSVKNAAANSWDAHQQFNFLIPSVVLLLNRYLHDNHSLSAQCVFFIGVLAYNPASRYIPFTTNLYKPTGPLHQAFSA
jgi:hypothetical protein